MSLGLILEKLNDMHGKLNLVWGYVVFVIFVMFMSVLWGLSSNEKNDVRNEVKRDEKKKKKQEPVVLVRNNN